MIQNFTSSFPQNLSSNARVGERESRNEYRA